MSDLTTTDGRPAEGGPARPVVVVDAPAQGGAAIPAYQVNADDSTLATQDGSPIEGGAALRVAEVTDRPVRGGAAMRVFVMNPTAQPTPTTIDNRPVQGGLPLPVFFVSAPPAPPSTLLDGLMAYYHFEEPSGVRVDATGRGNDLTPSATAPGAVLTGVQGVAPDSYSASFSEAFNNKLYRASTPDLCGGNGRSFTLCARIWSATPVNDSIIAKILGSTNEYFLFSSGGNVIMRVYTDGGAGFYDASRPNPADQSWHDIVAWYDADADTVNLQIDGGAISTTATVGNIVSGDSEFTVGNYQTGTLWWNGRIDEVGMAARVWTVAERAEWRNSGRGNPFPFDNPPAMANPQPLDAFPVLFKKAGGNYTVYWANGSDHSLTAGTIKQITSANFTDWTRAPNLESGANLAMTGAIELASGDILRIAQYGLATIPVPTMKVRIYRSTDGGNTWDAGTNIPNLLSGWVAPFSRPHQLAVGRILLPCYGANTGESVRAVLLYSDDDGITWDILSTPAYDGTNVLDFTEWSMANVSGTTWLGVFRADTSPFGANQNLRMAVSVDDGANWSPLVDMGITGVAPEVVMNGGGVAFLFYGNRASQRTSYRKSNVIGTSWLGENIIYQDTKADMSYPSAIFDGVNFRVSYYRENETSVNVWSKSAATM